MTVISYTNVVYFICMLTIAVGNGRLVSELLHRRMHCAAQAKRRETFLGFQGMQCGTFIKL